MTNGHTVRTRGAVLYTRVSTGEQDKHGTSPETQRDACRRKAVSLSLPIIAEYYDGGISGGFLLMRKEFLAALDDIKAGRADTLICPNISRFSRDVEHQQAVKKAVQAAGGRLVFCDMDFADTPEGDLNFTIQGGFAEYERKVIRKRSISGHHASAEAGIQTARMIAPYGYVIPKMKDIVQETYAACDLGKYLVVDKDAAIVRQLFVRYASGGSSLTDLCRWLNHDGVQPPGKAALWHISTLRYLLANPVYKGLASYGRFDHATDEARLGQTDPQTGRPLKTLKFRRAADPATWITWEVPAIVDADVWQQANAHLAQNRKLMSGNPRQVRMLSGRVVCPSCGAGMTVSAPGRRERKDGSMLVPPSRYVCTQCRQSIAHTGRRSCQPDAFNIPEVEAAVVLAVMDACRQPQSIQEAFAAYARHSAYVRQAALQARSAQASPSASADPRKEIEAIDEALQALAERHMATAKAQVTSIMAGAGEEVYNALLGEIAAERKGLENRRGVLAHSLREKPLQLKEKQPKDQSPVPNVSDLLDMARQILTSPDVTGKVKRDIVGTVIEKVVCRKGEEASGWGKKAGAEVVFLPAAFGEELFEEEARSIQQLSKQISSPTRPKSVFTAVA